MVGRALPEKKMTMQKVNDNEQKQNISDQVVDDGFISIVYSGTETKTILDKIIIRHSSFTAIEKENRFDFDGQALAIRIQ